ncbi:MAG: hypothetical protein FWD31_12780, partial [Planctomycetaceae bacterium]|nr:hypothetical protein [Planctomycetaceae bacterium]
LNRFASGTSLRVCKTTRWMTAIPTRQNVKRRQTTRRLERHDETTFGEHGTLPSNQDHRTVLK